MNMVTKRNDNKTDDMTKSELIMKIASFIKEYAKGMKKPSDVVPIKFNYWTGGAPDRVWHQSQIRFDGNDIYFRKTEITYENFVAIMEKALEESGCKGDIKMNVWEEERGRWPHSYYVKRWEFDNLTLLAKPCKEFGKLNNKLIKSGCKALTDDSVFSVSICGKRNSWSESSARQFLCHRPKTCEKALEFIKLYKTARDILGMELVEEFDRGDDYDYAMRCETEWYGSKGVSLRLKVTTPSGKVKGEIRVF